MTRGTFYLITDEKVLESTEFNGDMYMSGLGKEAKERLSEVKNEKEFTAMVGKFNEEHYSYDEKLIYEKDNMFDDGNKKYIDFTTDYFYRFSSDYIFIKNVSNRIIEFNTRNKEDDEIKDTNGFITEGETIVLNFGRFFNEEED